MDTFPFHHKFDPGANTTDQRPSTQETASTEPEDRTSTKSCKLMSRAHPRSNHSQSDTQVAKEKREFLNVDHDPQDGTINHEKGNGKVVLGSGSDGHEEALQALESYAAFQVALLHYLTDDSTCNEPPRQIIFPDTAFQSDPLSRPSMSDFAWEAHIDLPLTVMDGTNQDHRCYESEQNLRLCGNRG